MSKICSVWTAGDFNAKQCLGYQFSKSITKYGYKVDQRNPSFLPRVSLPPGDLVISNGLRSHIAPVAKKMKEERGAETIVYDLGYIKRSNSEDYNGYYQLGLNRIGWVPPFKCPSDRFKNLGVDVEPTVDNGSDTILVCAQKFKDAQHGMDEAQMIELMTEECEKWIARGYHVIFRSHPKSPFEIEGTEASTKTLKQEMDRSRLMVTYNSTSGVEAILNGTPVICLDPSAHYWECSSAYDESTNFIGVPSEKAITHYLHRLAYAQWTLKEVGEGYPLGFLLKVIAGEDPFDGSEDYTACQEMLAHPLPKKLEVEGRVWTEARAYVRDVTGEWPKNKEHMQEIVDRYNDEKED